MAITITDILERGPATSKEIQAIAGMSQTAVSRQLRRMGDSVVRLPAGRAPRYALTRTAFGGDDALPLYMVDAYGNNTAIAYIRPLFHGGFLVEALPGLPPVLLGVNQSGVFDDLPYFLSDLRPQGFLGRQIAAEMSSLSDEFPPDPRHWSTNQIGRYLVSNGDDLPGNFKFGHQAHLRVRRRTAAFTEKDYPELADSVMAGITPGSSAGGEQPKFTAYNASLSSHVIVKFTPKEDSVIARRWRDILITEHHATEALHHYDYPAAETRLIEEGGRLFLESRRFDRVSEYGRLPMVSLQSIDAEFVGAGSNWPLVVDSLYRANLISWQHTFDAECLWIFGQLINNTDMHLGNLSFAIEGSVFRLLPAYDMCSMGFAPKGGDILPYNFQPPNLSVVNLDEDSIPHIKDIAHKFWERVADDARISEELKAFLSQGNPVAFMNQ